MATYRGEARLTTRDGRQVKPKVTVELKDDHVRGDSLRARAPFHGTFWVSEGDLLEPLRDHAHCLLLLEGGTTIEVHVYSFDRGGARAQVAGEGQIRPPFPGE